MNDLAWTMIVTVLWPCVAVALTAAATGESFAATARRITNSYMRVWFQILGLPRHRPSRPDYARIAQLERELLRGDQRTQ